MTLRNGRQHYGVISILMHWVMAVLVIGLFALGLYMTGLSYYDPWYVAAPNWHRSLGVVVLSLLLVRMLWRVFNPPPEAAGGPSKLERLLALVIHRLLYLLVLLIGVSGYMISTAEGRGIEVFGWFSLPALIPPFDNMEEVAGDVHYLLALSLMALVALHALAALKHHFIDRDATLLRILRVRTDLQ